MSIEPSKKEMGRRFSQINADYKAKISVYLRPDFLKLDFGIALTLLGQMLASDLDQPKIEKEWRRAIGKHASK